MAQIRLTPRHKEMLTSLAEALKRGDMGVEWILSTASDGVSIFCMDKDDANPGQLSGWTVVQHADFRKFADLGLLKITRLDDHGFPDYLIFDEAEVLYLVDNNFEEPTPASQGAVHITSSNSIINVQTTLNNSAQTINNSSSLQEDAKHRLENLINDLKAALEAVPSEHSENTETVAVYAQRLVADVASPKPNKGMIEISADGLKKAAANIAAIAPPVLVTVNAILEFVIALHR